MQLRMTVAALAALAITSSALAQDLSTATPIAGAWTYAATSTGSQAVFGSAGGLPQLTLSCTRANRLVTISKAASAPASAMMVWTTSMSRNLPASFSAETARISASLPMLDPLLDAMAMSRGRIGVSTPGVAPLVVPAWPEVARVVEDCRA